MRRQLAIPLLAASAASMGALCEPPPPGVLEIGMRQPDAGFVPLEEGELMAVELGPNGLNMLVPSLRAVEIDPRVPDPSVEVAVAGILMAADIEGSRVDMQDDGVGYVLWDLRVPFQTELCCYNCRDAHVTAKIVDASGRTFEGEVTVPVARADCPDDMVCCSSADLCPDPALARVCE